MTGDKKRKKVDKYVIHFDETLGSGAYASVYVCYHEITKQPYAIKVIDKSKLQNSTYLEEALKQEISIHFSLKHTNIVSVFDIIETSRNYYIVQELCRGGNLRQLIAAHSIFKESDALHCIKCICRAFKPMLEKGIIHRDLKPDNLVIENMQIKITDFGFAKALCSSRQMTRTVIGTPLYMSPQILNKEPYSSKCDIWSIGVIFYELLFGKHPWNAPNLRALHRKILQQPKPHFPESIQISPAAKSFILKCLQIDEQNRFCWLQLYEHQLLGEQFHSVAESWRESYVSAANKLDSLKETIEIQKLVGIFLRLKCSSLNFKQFQAIMIALIPSVENQEIALMYELFDKDFNGVIDFEQFVGGLSSCPPQILKLLSTLIEKGHFYDELSDSSMFDRLCEEQGFTDEQVKYYAFILISNMQF